METYLRLCLSIFRVFNDVGQILITHYFHELQMHVSNFVSHSTILSQKSKQKKQAETEIEISLLLGTKKLVWTQIKETSSATMNVFRIFLCSF